MASFAARLGPVVLNFTAVMRPVMDAAPTTRVMAISVGEKFPETMRAQPSRKSQIAVMISSQKTKHGRAAHLVRAEFRAVRTIAIQNGVVWTMWRRMPWETAPTMSSAAMAIRQHRVRMRSCGCIVGSMSLVRAEQCKCSHCLTRRVRPGDGA